MDIKQITVVVENTDVTIKRQPKGFVEVIVHELASGGWKIDGTEEDVKAAQNLVRSVTRQDWKRTHTSSMVRELVDLLRRVAGV